MEQFYTASISQAVQSSSCARSHFFKHSSQHCRVPGNFFPDITAYSLRRFRQSLTLKRSAVNRQTSILDVLKKRLFFHEHVTQTRINEFTWKSKMIIKCLSNHRAESFSTEQKMRKNVRAKPPLKLVTEPHNYMHRYKGNPLYCKAFCFLKARWATAKNKSHCMGIASHKIGRNSIILIRKKMTVATHLNLT